MLQTLFRDIKNFGSLLIYVNFFIWKIVRFLGIDLKNFIILYPFFPKNLPAFLQNNPPEKKKYGDARAPEGDFVSRYWCPPASPIGGFGTERARLDIFKIISKNCHFFTQ